MAFQTASGITSLDNLLTALANFANSNGFTKLTNIVVSGRQSDMYVLQKGSMYWWFLGFSATDGDFGTYGEIECRMMTTAPTEGNRETTALGQSQPTRIWLGNKPDGTYATYWFFADSNAIHAVIELGTGQYTHLSFGDTEKQYSFTGGEYLDGTGVTSISLGYSGSGFTLNNSYLSAVFGGATSQIARNGYLYYPYESHGDQRDWSVLTVSTTSSIESRRTVMPAPISTEATALSDLLGLGPNLFNDRAPTYPIIMRTWDNRASGGTQLYDPASHIHNARLLNIETITPQDLVDTDWMVFPQFSKEGDNTLHPVTGDKGVAYKKVV